MVEPPPLIALRCSVGSPIASGVDRRSLSALRSGVKSYEAVALVGADARGRDESFSSLSATPCPQPARCWPGAWFGGRWPSSRHQRCRGRRAGPQPSASWWPTPAGRGGPRQPAAIAVHWSAGRASDRQQGRSWAAWRRASTVAKLALTARRSDHRIQPGAGQEAGAGRRRPVGAAPNRSRHPAASRRPSSSSDHSWAIRTDRASRC